MILLFMKRLRINGIGLKTLFFSCCAGDFRKAFVLNMTLHSDFVKNF